MGFFLRPLFHCFKLAMTFGTLGAMMQVELDEIKLELVSANFTEVLEFVDVFTVITTVVEEDITTTETTVETKTLPAQMADLDWKLNINQVFCQLSNAELALELQNTGKDAVELVCGQLGDDPVKHSILPGSYCNASYDGIMCWPSTLAGEKVSRPCPNFNATTIGAYKVCQTNGVWENLTDYKECLVIPVVPLERVEEDITTTETIVETTTLPTLMADSDWKLNINQLFCQLSNAELALELQNKGSYCNASHDDIVCWPPTLAGGKVSLPCPNFNATTIRAYKVCQTNGVWENWTDYKECLAIPVVPTFPEPPVALDSALSYVYLVGCALSLVLLAISLFIFCYFKSLRCTRISIHKHLVVSFMLRYICMIVVLQTSQPDSGNTTNHLRAPGFCRFVLVVLEYSCMANLFWMFVEGLYLTSRLSMAVFSNEANFKMYLLIGWVSPMFAVITWAMLMHYEDVEPCWEHYLEEPYIWIVRVPMMAAILVNSIFLINIIIILWTKLRASNSMETAQLRKAVKAVAVLFPLLGLTNLVFFWAPSNPGVSENIYSVINAVLQASQGIFVAVIYCFLNQEVRLVVKRRISSNRDPYCSNTRGRRTTQTNANGSCVIPTTSEVSGTFQKKFKKSPSDETHEMKPFTTDDTNYQQENDIENNNGEKDSLVGPCV